jgi:hypothetical protein
MLHVQPEDHAALQRLVMILWFESVLQSPENLDLNHLTHKGLGRHLKFNDQ